ncbi:D-aminoacyl-tRNA deacylase [Saccharicrinis fermentans]|uniref:D-aminoacyl-tRNA deacylase n=1 Tax=Saccharicrinis fermentans DSM 9555 = JCM 21142 TaxID=869213 RepID=W7Y1E4_9BACT|nr:D-aminoacyl-tRNA deacylase [Saccharicrinis fermentans]GAF01787.1 D-tyrosyl-tRNA deacylase [Saccharicrinis fermentans DSM 9555 = JCM 21142]
MRVVVQRVSEASVTINNNIVSSIQNGLLVLLGITNDDDKNDIEWLCKKIANLRIFSDHSGVMNQSLLDVNGELLIVSQFTLYAKTKKGNRPSYIEAAKTEVSKPLYEAFISYAGQLLGKEVKTGVFGAQMKVSLTNNGPVTIIIDSKNRE